jgi:SAM-dependent methyltransferase
MNQPFNFDNICKIFASYVVRDPIKQFVQYPWAVAQLPPHLRGLKILDIGCGEGSLARTLAKKGALVCGYDISIEQIRRARLEEEKESLGIEYIHADQANIIQKVHSESFDIALAVNVLHYAPNRNHLEMFFSSTYQIVKPGSLFVALVMNPGFKRFGQKIYNRRYRRKPNGRIYVDFFDEKTKIFSVFHSDFTWADYHEAATRTGWEKLTRYPVKVTDEGENRLGLFWNGFEEDCPYAGFSAIKSLK